MRLARQQWVLILAAALLAAALAAMLATGTHGPSAPEVRTDADQVCTELTQAQSAFATGTDGARRVGMELLDQAVKTARTTVQKDGSYAPILAETDSAHRISHEVGLEGGDQVVQAIGSALRACVRWGQP